VLLDALVIKLVCFLCYVMSTIKRSVTFRRNVRPFSSLSKKPKRVAAPLPLQRTLKKKALWSFETSTVIDNSTRYNIPEDLSLNSKILLWTFSKNMKNENFF
jgi:hypothetical protein